MKPESGLEGARNNMEQNSNWKQKTLLVGVLLGALSGLLAAYMLIQRAEKDETRPHLSTGEGVKVGLGVLGLLRLVSELADRK